MSREVFNNIGTSSARLHNILDHFMIITADLWSLRNLEHQQQKSWYPCPRWVWTWVVLRLTLSLTATFFASYLTRQKKSSNIIRFILCPKASGADRLPPVFWMSWSFKFCIVLFAFSHWKTPWEWSTHVCDVVGRVAVSSRLSSNYLALIKKTCFRIIMKCCALRFYYIVHIAVVLPLLISLISPWKSTPNPPTVHSRISA